jgi:hypothetical protein
MINNNMTGISLDKEKSNRDDTLQNQTIHDNINPKYISSTLTAILDINIVSQLFLKLQASSGFSEL